MPLVSFINEKKSLVVPRGFTILKAARAAGVIIESPCGGMGSCGKCGVRVPDPAHLRSLRLRDTGETRESETSLNREGEVLACRTCISGDTDVLVRDYGAENRSLKILTGGRNFSYAVDPFIVREGPCFGAVVDIGTTTLAAVLADLHGGAELASASALNPQSRYAQDVLSRIHFASGPGGLETLRGTLFETLRVMIGDLAAEAGIRREHIYELVFCGNTAMLHLACGADPAPLGRFPYTPVIRGGGHAGSAEEAAAALGIAPGGLIYLPPIISAYVGADISAGILAAELAERRGTTVFIDIGTNGEIVLAHEGL
ncbi:MAG: 2Fe-2S iron-sulfur cluster binding domain-containing protein, partial [Treponema sp.]|nr:2Fe-2S iron-sulfur cluster binding domain-containing protein [Treponema sp.]